MDKSWMSKDRLSTEFKDGVESFMNFAMQHVSNLDAMPCPCVKCGNLSRKKSELVRLHLLSNGMDLTYHTWLWHGERSSSTSQMNHSDQRYNIENLIYEDQLDMVHAAYDETDNPSEFMKIIEDAEKPLYPECVKFTKLSAIMKLYNLKTKHGWSDKSFNDLLILLRDMLPATNELPESIYNAKRSLIVLGMEYEKIYACPNDCVLYRKIYEDCTSCPTCGASRWKISTNSTSKKQIPAKVLWYFPPIPRFQRMFRNKSISKNLTWHADKRVKDGYLRLPADSPNWKVVDHKWPDFASESRNLRLGKSADGINPHSLMNTTYSCWLVLLVTYNLPPWLCLKWKFIMLTLLIAGPKQPGNDIDVYLAPLVDDLSKLWSEGVPSFDASKNESFLLRAVLLWTINDFPAYGNLSGCKVKGYHACPICGENTSAKRLKYSQKMSYTRHRRYLDPNHPYKRQRKAFDGTQEKETAPKPLNGREILKKVEAIKCQWGKLSKGNDSRDKSMWKKKSIFFELEYWEHLHIRHILDVMHIEENICESIIGTLLDITGKTKDGLASRRDLKHMKIRTDLAPVESEKRTYLPPACYTLSKAEKRLVCESLSGMKVPTGYSSNVNKLVSLKDLKLIGLKLHDCHTLMQQLLPVAIRGVLPDNVRCAITRLCFFFNVVCSKVIDVSKLDDIHKDIVTTLCLLDKYFPPSFFDIMVHLAVHLVREVKLCGPVWFRWMYPFERYMRVLKSYVRNRNRPEWCIAECYIAEETVEFCSDYLPNVQTCGIPAMQQHGKITQRLPSGIVHSINNEELGQAHRHVLANDVEIDPFIEEHITNLKKLPANKGRSAKWFQDQHNRLFSRWLRDQVASQNGQSTLKISERLKWIANGPLNDVLKHQTYLVDGITFSTKERDDNRTVQNSGVSLVARTMQVSSAKDKNPIVSDMVFYGVIREIWELDYRQFRIPVFKCDWVNNESGVKIEVKLNRIGYKDDSFILATQAKQVFYIKNNVDCEWFVVLSTPSREYFEYMGDGQFQEIVIQHPCSRGAHYG